MIHQDSLQQINLIGQPISRRDGPHKVTGQARYTAEFDRPNIAHAVLAQSPIAAGRIVSIDTSEAERAPGVILALTHLNMPRIGEAGTALSDTGSMAGEQGFAGQRFLPLQGDVIEYYGQHIGLIIAETLEQATYAANLFHVEYQPAPHAMDFEEAAKQTFLPVSGWPEPIQGGRGDAATGLSQADVHVAPTYVTALQHHVTLEPHATLAEWDDTGEQLTVHEPTTFVYGAKLTLSKWLQMPPEKIRVINDFVGGSFGCKGPIWPHVYIAAVAAKIAKRPVKLVLTREQTFTSNGYRPHLRHKMTLGAKRDGAKLTTLSHHAVAHTATFDDRTVAPVTKTTPKMYDCANVAIGMRSTHLNLGGPFTFRGPGETPGLYAVECAMDELAYALNIDPIELRLANYAETDPEEHKPWSSKSLRECYKQGAERFGWVDRNPKPASTRDGTALIGMGMAGMMYDAKSSPTQVSATLDSSGMLTVQTSTCDQGTGSYTIFPQIAAQTLGVPLEFVRFELGDTDQPQAPISAGSQTAASVGTATQSVCMTLRHNLLTLAFIDSASPLHRKTEGEVGIAEGRAFVIADPEQGEPLAAIASRQLGGKVAAMEKTNPTQSKQSPYSSYSFGAHFAEVRLDPDLGELRVSRYVGAFGAGRILNAKTAHSQLIGGIVWGIGQALMEETHLDQAHGIIANRDLAEYYIPVNADIPRIDAFFVEEDDPHVNPIGTKSIGEIGTIGAAAAIANAVYHATGKRVRDLPITVEKLL